MGRGKTLKSALEAHKGVDHKVKKQAKYQKEAEKRKKKREGLKPPPRAEADRVGEPKQGELKAKAGKAKGDSKNKKAGGVKLNGDANELGGVKLNGKVEDAEEQWESDESNEGEEAGTIDIAGLDDTDSSSSGEDDEDEEIDVAKIDSTNAAENAEEKDEDEDDEEAEEEDDIPLSDLSDLSDSEKADMIPHQRLTINNTTALLSALSSISLPYASLPFSAHQSVTSTTPTAIPSIDDDLTRELAFYKQSLTAAQTARSLLKKEKVPFSRPTDFFAEMVKSDEHMGKIRAKMVDEAARKKASADARKQRDLKKFGKQVQVAKLQERDKAKRETLDKIKVLKRKRQSGDNSADAGENEANDLFDVALDNAVSSRAPPNNKDSRPSRAGGKPTDQNKRQKRDQKFGFGGKKRFSKSGDAASSADMSGFSVGKMKGRGPGDRKGGSGGGKGGGGSGQRLGKSRRKTKA
ncbi:MAG: hypothetical protein M1819_005100 [Sarea resinae]|nr:MAG: hypothetical protein M1819_005100 [Sarea resinae]